MSAPTPAPVDVWVVRLSEHIGDGTDPAALLSPTEHERAARFHAARDRRRFIAAHAALRILLGRHLDMPPGAIGFATGPHGKPRLRSAAPLDFNLSHSADLALVAITRGQAVGVDIERIEPEIEHDLICEQFFSAAERAVLRATGAADKAAAFTACWTRKEAYIKATGAGVTHGLDHFDVAFSPGAPPALLADRRDPSWARWMMAALPAPAGFEAALVVEAPAVAVTMHDFN